MKVKFICANSYDFKDEHENRITGVSAKIFIPDENDVAKAKVSCNEDFYLKSCKFGDEVDVDVTVKGRYANYVLN